MFSAFFWEGAADWRPLPLYANSQPLARVRPLGASSAGRGPGEGQPSPPPDSPCSNVRIRRKRKTIVGGVDYAIRPPGRGRPIVDVQSAAEHRSMAICCAIDVKSCVTRRVANKPWRRDIKQFVSSSNQLSGFPLALATASHVCRRALD